MTLFSWAKCTREQKMNVILCLKIKYCTKSSQKLGKFLLGARIKQCLIPRAIQTGCLFIFDNVVQVQI